MRPILAVVALITFAAPARGQRIADLRAGIGQPTAALTTTVLKPAPPNTAGRVARTVAAGLLVGVVGGVIGARIGHAHCSEGDRDDNDCALPSLVGFMFGGSIGAVTGLVVGWQMTKPKPAPSQTRAQPTG